MRLRALHKGVKTCEEEGEKEAELTAVPGKVEAWMDTVGTSMETANHRRWRSSSTVAAMGLRVQTRVRKKAATRACGSMGGEKGVWVTVESDLGVRARWAHAGGRV